MKNSVLRIVDANFNRTTEAFRVVEDFARFVLDSRSWASQVKKMRHRLFETVSLVGDSMTLAASRDTQGDVGTALTAPTEETRQSLDAVLAANLKRAAEGLRVLEEYTKVLNADAAKRLKELRYEWYDLEKGLLARVRPNARLNTARLYALVTTGLCSGRNPVAVARDAVAGGADIIQMREKEMLDGEFINLARRLREVCDDAGVLFVVNDRVAVAQLVDADGVHVGQDDLPAAEVRRLLGNDKIVGVSTHSPEQAAAAIAAGADYIGVGPVNATPTKATTAPVGLGYVRYAAEHVDLPFFTIGGVNLATASEVIAAGARRLAVCSAIISAEDVAAATRDLKAMLPALEGGETPDAE